MSLSTYVVAACLALTAVGHPTTSLARRDLVQRERFDIDRLRPHADASYVSSTEFTSSVASAGFTSPDLAVVAEEFVKQTVPGATFRLSDDHYVGLNGIAHFYFKQTANGLDVDNADMNVNIAPDGTVFSFGNSFFTGEVPSDNPKRLVNSDHHLRALETVKNAIGLPISTDLVSVENRGEVEVVFKEVSGVHSEPTAKLVYYQNAEKQLVPAWRLETDINTNWFVTYANAEKPEEILATVDYASDVTYEVYPWGVDHPAQKGAQRVKIQDPWQTMASEFGWHEDGKEKFTTTRGNNAVAGINWDNTDEWGFDPRPDNKDLDFSYPYSLNMTDFKSYGNASVTQLFYTSDIYHDLLYLLGFDEKAGNFEVNNNGQGGKGNDAVILNAQDGSGTNNANFLTPPDGTPGRMRMYMWTRSTPQRDCSFDAGVVIHEYTHGLSNRLTGGPSNSGCLGTTEAGGLGEGWSDFMAIALRTKLTDTRATNYPMGEWVFNDPKGIRRFPYSTDMTVNTHTFKDVAGLSRVHEIGTVWATILYEVLWNFIEDRGITADTWPNMDDQGIPTDGRFLLMRLVMDGMALQPCSPTFIQARNAIIDADVVLTKGANACSLWKGFAKRGLGEGATRGTNSFTVPDGACKSK